MRKCTLGLVFYLFAQLFQPAAARALTDTSDLLVVEPGENIAKYGTVYKNVSIYVKALGRITIPPPDGVVNLGALRLVAPFIRIDGYLVAANTGFNDKGAGTGPGSSPTSLGGGGGGYGGKGGGGAYYSSSGGATYDTPYRIEPGSYGWLGNNSTPKLGGGGSLQLDAISLTLGANSRFYAIGNTVTVNAVGGGSGGGILLNGIQTVMNSGYVLYAYGGDGGNSNSKYGAAGGGGGGKIKIVRYNAAWHHDSGGSSNKIVSGGNGGSNYGNDGNSGTSELLDAPSPNTPNLLAPANLSVVGSTPSFSFLALDTLDSKFLKYKLEISLVSNFSSVFYTANQQTDPADPGWGGKSYFSSGEQAVYAMPSPLALSTTYYWRVSVTNNLGATWILSSDTWQFTTVAQAKPKPTVPLLLQPTSGQIHVSKIPAFRLAASHPEPLGNTLTFTLMLSLDSQLSNPQIFDATYAGWDHPSYFVPGSYIGITATCQIQNAGSQMDALVPGTTYYWKVIVFDALQQSSESAVGTFETVDRPTVPTLLGPASGSIVTTKRPGLRVQAQSPTLSPLQYKVELSPDDYQTWMVFQSQSGSSWTHSEYASDEPAELIIPPAYALVPGQRYVWRAYAYDVTNDNWSLPLENLSFTVVVPPLLPEAISPENGYIAPNSRLTFQAQATSESGNTLTYRFELTDSDFASPWFQSDQRTHPEGWSALQYASGLPAVYTLPASVSLSLGKTYFWRMLATDGISWGPPSPSRSFSLANSLIFQRIRIYPNPAVSTDVLQLQIQLTVDARATLSICNQLGKEIKRQDKPLTGGTNGNTLALDISRFASGIYLLIIQARSDFGSGQATARFAVVR